MSYFEDEDEYEYQKNESNILDESLTLEITRKEPRVLLMGLRRSGKSSIQKVVFHKLAPNETLFLESTSKVTKDNIISFVDFQVWDFPGQIDFFDPTFDADLIFGEVSALVYVVDAQDDYSDSLTKLYETIMRAFRVCQHIHFDVFIHKVDGLSEDLKFETQRDIQQRILDELSDSGMDNQVQLNFYLTSIYDHSIYESFSKVIQKLIPQLPALENLVNILCSNSGIEKAYLFDITSKIYIATDSSPVDLMSYEICCDLIDVVVDMTIIYQPTITNNKNVNEDSYSIIKLDNELILYYREINRYLGLVCLIKSEYWDKHAIIDFNFDCFRLAILDVLDVRKKYLEEDIGPDGLGII